MEYLVTGGAGFIGSHLVDALVENGENVIVVDDFSSGKKKNLAHHKKNKRLHVYEKNVCDDLTDIFQGRTIEAVFHLAASSKVQFSLQHPLGTHNVNINGTLNALLACKKFSVKKFIFASSCAIYGMGGQLSLKESVQADPLSPYALHKIVGEQYCKLFSQLYGLHTIILRYFNVFGPRQDAQDALIPKFITLTRKGLSPVINGDGEQTRDFIYISDVIRATIRASHFEGNDFPMQIFNVGSGKNISVNKVAQSIIELDHQRMEPCHVAPVIEPRHVLADISKAREILRWEPEVSFEEGLKKTYDYIAA